MPLSPASHNPGKSGDRQVGHLHPHPWWPPVPDTITPALCGEGKLRMKQRSLCPWLTCTSGHWWYQDLSPRTRFCVNQKVWVLSLKDSDFWKLSAVFLLFFFFLWVYNARGLGHNQMGAESPVCVNCVGWSSSSSSRYHGVIGFLLLLLFQEENVHLLPRSFIVLGGNVLTLAVCLPARHSSWCPVGPHSTIVE